MLRSDHRRSAALLACIISAFLGVDCHAGAQLAPIDPHQTPTLLAQSLRLEVSINGVDTRLVEPFVMTTDGVLLAKPADLEDAGIKVSGFPDPLKPIDLRGLQGVTYRYEPSVQRIDFLLGESQRLAHVYDAHPASLRAPAPQSDYGLVTNYSLFGTTTNQLGTLPKFSGANATLDTRGFTPFGEMSQTGILGNTAFSRNTALRLDTTYSYSDPDRMLTGRFGDTISGGLLWTRPFRYGGIQVQRDFNLRSDLVTQPLPNITGSAAVPSTVDVFVNSVKTFSQDVAPGPYSITNLPVVSGNGTAHVVVTDTTGKTTESAVPFFNTPTLLAQGISDFSVDVGLARRNYGLLSNDYDKQPVASTIGRYGLTDWMTIEGHGEGGAGLENLGFGGVARAGRWGTVSAAVDGSRYGSQIGALFYGEYDIDVAGFNIDASTQRTLKSFNDLASVTATVAPLPSLASAFAAGVYSLDPRPPHSLDRITLGIPLKFVVTSLSVSFINLVEASGTRSRILTASLSRPLPFDASVFVTGFVDFAQRKSAGVFAGLSVPLGPSVRANVGGSYGGSGRYGEADVGQPLQPSDGSVGWRVRDLEGTNAIRIGDAAYRSGYGTAQVEVSQEGRTFSTQGELDGAFGYINHGGVFVGNHIADGFAVVDTGIAGVPVFRDNRLIGETNPWGQLVVADLRSYQGNQIAIDPLGLPANAEARSTKQVVVPAARSGVGLNFGVDKQVDAAMVRLTDTGGQTLAVGVKGHRKDDSESFVVGYDGQAYVKHLQQDNVVIIDLGDHDCTASFPYQKSGGKRVTIGPVPCH